MNQGPPPLPSYNPEQDVNHFAHQAANVCFGAPLLVCAFAFWSHIVSQNTPDSFPRELALVLFFVAGGLCLVGCALGVLSLFLARPVQRTSVGVRAIVGLVLIGLLAGIAIPNFVRGREMALERKQALEQLHAASADIKKQTVAFLTNGQSQAVDTRQLRHSLDAVAEKSTGDTLALTKSTKLFLDDMQIVQHDYAQAVNELKSAKVLSAATLEQREEIQARKAIVQRFLAANEACRNFVLHGVSFYSNRLAAAGISAAHKEEALKGFRRNADAQLPLILNVRETDDRMGKAMLGVLSLFDEQWGQWSYDSDARIVRFQSHNSVEQYNSLMTEFKRAVSEQAAASQKLAAVVSRNTSTF